MRSTFRTAAALIGTAALASCATSTPYEPAAGPGDEGYRDTRVETDTYRVVFEGNEATSRQTVETYLLFRAAQIAENTGHRFFRVIARDSVADIELETYPTYTPYVAPRAFYGFGYGAFPYYTAVPFRAGYTGFRPLADVDVEDSYRSVAFIEVYEERPADDTGIYNASEVIRRLASEIRYPGERGA